MSQPPPKPVQAGPPQQSNIVTDPYGSGATFSGNPNSPQYNADLEKWLLQRHKAYTESPQYQQDQYRDNPDVRSGAVPTVGFSPQGPNAWFIPEGATVTKVEKTGEGYNIAYQERGIPQQVKVEGPGYAIEGTVYARNAQEAAVKAMGSTRAQYLGLDVSPSKLGGYVSDMRGSSQASVQVGDPERNKYWGSVGLPQFSGYSIPKLSVTQQAEGFYIKSVESAGASPKVSVANAQWESFWKQQGFPQYGNYQPVSLGQGEYVAAVTADDKGQLQVSTGNRDWEKQWQSLGVTDVSLVRGYAPPSNVTEGSYVRDVTKIDGGLNYVLGNTITEAKLADINTQLETISGQNQKFVDYYNADPAKRGSDFLKAMTVQNQKAASLLGEAESYGFITGEQRQTRLSELDVNMKSVSNFISNQEKSSNMFAVNSNVERSASASVSTQRGLSAMPQDTSVSNVLVQGGTTWQKVTPSTPKVNDPLGQTLSLFGAFISNPVKATGALLNPIGQAISQDSTPLGQVARFGVGFIGGELNLAESMQKGVLNLSSGKPVVEPKPLLNITVPNMKKPDEPIYNPSDPIQITGRTAYDVASAVAVSAVIPAAAPKVVPIAASSILKAGLLNVGLTEGITYAMAEYDNNPDTKYTVDPVRISQSFALGEGFAVAGAGALKAASKLDPTLVASRGGRAVVSMGVGGGAGYILSGGDPVETVQGALVAGAFTVGGELASSIKPVISRNIPTIKYGKSTIPLDEPTITKGVREAKEFSDFYGIKSSKVMLSEYEVPGTASFNPSTEIVTIAKGAARNTLQHELGHAAHFELSKTPEGIAYLESFGIKPHFASTTQEAEVTAWQLAGSKAKAYGQLDKSFSNDLDKSLSSYKVEDFNASFKAMQREVNTSPSSIGSKEQELFAKEVAKPPLNVPTEVNYKGLYIQQGQRVRLVTGKKFHVPEGAVIKSHGPSGEGKSYAPETPLDALITFKTMARAGYPDEILHDVADVNYIMRQTQYAKPKNIEQMLPVKTGTLSEKGVSTVKDYVIENKNVVSELYGSYTTKPQVSKTFEYTKEGVSALREPGDIDVQLNTNVAGAEKFAAELTGRLKLAGEDVKLTTNKQGERTLIEANVGGGKYAHAVDIHYKGEATDSLTPTVKDEMIWGFRINQNPIKIEKIPVMRASEQGLRKGTKIIEFNEDATLGPPKHRTKDIPDFFQVQRTLLETKQVSLEESGFNRLVQRYGVTDVLSEPTVITERYIVNNPDPQYSLYSMTPTSLRAPSSLVTNNAKNKLDAEEVSNYSYPAKIYPTMKSTLSSGLSSSKLGKSSQPIYNSNPASTPYNSLEIPQSPSLPSVQVSNNPSIPKIGYTQNDGYPSLNNIYNRFTAKSTPKIASPASKLTGSPAMPSLFVSSSPSKPIENYPPSNTIYNNPSQPIPPNDDPYYTTDDDNYDIISPPIEESKKRKRKQKSKPTSDIDKWVRYYPVANPLEIT